MEVIKWKIMEWSIQIATGYQQAIKWQGVEIAIKSLLDLSTGARLIGQLDKEYFIFPFDQDWLVDGYGYLLTIGDSKQ